MFGATKIEMTILSLLRSGSRLYGLEMVRAAGDKLKRGTVYVYLSRMEEKGWVSSEAEKEISMPGMPRRLYRITGKGQSVYERAIATEASFASWEEGLAT